MKIKYELPRILPLFLLMAAINAYADKTPWNNYVLGYAKPVKEGLLGDMWGIRSDLADHGFTFRLAYLTESAYNISGGYNTDRHYAFVDDTAFTFTQDLERYTDIPDARIDGNIVNRNHDDDLTDLRLDHPKVTKNDQAQEGSNAGQSITRLGWLTFSRSFLDRKLNWRVGMINKRQDFDQVIPCDFQLLSLCGGKSAKSRLWFNWNVHYWGTAFQYKLTPEVTLKSGLMEYNTTTPDRSHAWSWSTRGSKGFLLPMEVQWQTTKVLGLPGAYNLGLVFTNGERNDLYDGQQRNRTWYLYSSFNQQITQHQDNANRGMSISNSFGLGDERTMAFRYVNSTTVRYRGLFDARPNDMVALGVTYNETSRHYVRKQQHRNQVSGISDVTSPLWAPVPGHSVNLAMYYNIQATPWLSIQPEIQYWHHPGAVASTQDAWVGAFKTQITF
ncbi:TPA: carbohydrate porin [Klebsiella pneumoniae]